MARHVVGRVEEVPPEGRVVAEIEGREVGVFNVDGEFYAVLNHCPHQGGPLCEGKLGGTFRVSFDRDTLKSTRSWVHEGRIIACPWHNWQYDVTTGASLSKPGVGVPVYEVTVEDGLVIVHTQS